MSIKKVLTFCGWPLLLIPTLVLWIGAGMNEAVVWANGGQMPVSAYACQTRFESAPAEDDAVPALFGTPHAQKAKDYIHKCADKNTRLRLLDDWMLGDDGISSIGDLLQAELSPDLKTPCYLLWTIGGIFYLVRKQKPYLE